MSTPLGSFRRTRHWSRPKRTVSVRTSPQRSDGGDAGVQESWFVLSYTWFVKRNLQFVKQTCGFVVNFTTCPTQQTSPNAGDECPWSCRSSCLRPTNCRGGDADLICATLQSQSIQPIPADKSTGERRFEQLTLDRSWLLLRNGQYMMHDWYVIRHSAGNCCYPSEGYEHP